MNNSLIDLRYLYIFSFISWKKLYPSLNFRHHRTYSEDWKSWGESWRKSCKGISPECSDMEVSLLRGASSLEVLFSFDSGTIASVSISSRLARVLVLPLVLLLLLPPLLLLLGLLLRRLRDLPLLRLARVRLRLLLRLPFLLLSLALLLLAANLCCLLLLFLARTPNRQGWLGQGSITPSPVPSPNDSCPR